MYAVWTEEIRLNLHAPFQRLQSVQEARKSVSRLEELKMFRWVLRMEKHSPSGGRVGFWDPLTSAPRASLEQSPQDDHEKERMWSFVKKNRMIKELPPDAVVFFTSADATGVEARGLLVSNLQAMTKPVVENGGMISAA